MSSILNTTAAFGFCQQTPRSAQAPVVSPLRARIATTLMPISPLQQSVLRSVPRCMELALDSPVTPSDERESQELHLHRSSTLGMYATSPSDRASSIGSPSRSFMDDPFISLEVVLAQSARRLSLGNVNSSTTTLKEVRLKLEALTGLSPEGQRLIVGGKELPRASTIRNSGGAERMDDSPLCSVIHPALLRSRRTITILLFPN